jgi:hypothetical protein
MSKKTAMIASGLAVVVLVIWIGVQKKRQSDFEKQPPVIQAVSEIEKNLKEADQKAK